MRNFVFFKSLVVFLCLCGMFVFAQPVMSFGVVSEEHYSEVEVILDGQFSLSDIASLPRAPGSDLEVLKGGKRVKVQLPVGLVDELVEAGAKVGIFGSFAVIEGGVEDMSEGGDAAINQSCAGSTITGSNGADITIPDNTTPGILTVYSPIVISGAPAGSKVRCMDITWRICHDWPMDVAAAVFNYVGDKYRIVWYQDVELGCFGEKVVDTTTFGGEPVNQQWELWAGDWANSGDVGYITEWEITLYYFDYGGYCDANGDCFENIERVEVGDIDNSTSDMECVGGYADYTSLSTDMEPGVSYPIAVTIFYPDGDDRVGVWIDWDQDKIFDVGTDEEISMSGNPSAGYFTGTITPPLDAAVGPTRMRVRVQWDSGVGPGVSAEPCGSGVSGGEVEDYTIVVVGEPPPPGDMDGDGDVDMIDVDELCEMWLTDDVTCDIYPEVGDGIVNMGDFAVQAEDYGP